MIAPPDQQIETEICSFVASLLGRSCEPQDDLRSIGVDSIAFLEVVIFIEKRFKVPLPLDLITSSHAATVRLLASHLATLRSPSTPA